MMYFCALDALSWWKYWFVWSVFRIRWYFLPFFVYIVVCFDLFATLFLLISGDMADRFASASVYMGMIFLIASAFALLFRAFAGISRLFLTFGGIPACIFCRSASMRRLSRLARARISRVPDVGFGRGDGFACGLCRRSQIFSWFCRCRMRGFPGSCLRPESFCAALRFAFWAFGKGEKSGLILRWDRLPGWADRKISAVSGKIGRNFTGKFLKMFWKFCLRPRE